MIYDKNENAQEVAQRFSDIHSKYYYSIIQIIDLDEEMTEKLTELIEQQMSELTTV